MTCSDAGKNIRNFTTIRTVLGAAARRVSRVDQPGMEDRHMTTVGRGERQMSGIDKMKNKAEELGGHGKESVGEATGDRDLQAEGKKDKTTGNLKQAGEKVKDAFK